MKPLTPKRSKKGLKLPNINLTDLPSSERLIATDVQQSNEEQLESTQAMSIPKALKLDVQLYDLQLLQELGAGNGGTVHKVLHKVTGTVMALKVKNKLVKTTFF
jgi:mitogen-activated protein kinase kinase